MWPFFERWCVFSSAVAVGRNLLKVLPDYVAMLKHWTCGGWRQKWRYCLKKCWTFSGAKPIRITIWIQRTGLGWWFAYSLDWTWVLRPRELEVNKSALLMRHIRMGSWVEFLNWHDACTVVFFLHYREIHVLFVRARHMVISRTYEIWDGLVSPTRQLRCLYLDNLYYNGFTMVSAILGVSFLSPCRRENSIFARNTSSKMFSINPCSSTSRRPRNRDKSRQSESEGLFQFFGQLNQAKFVCF